ncbi:MAG: SUMF1/EgtB/PvdO family nonheme iron enzyme [gamma proteobacterium symbiont of Taylorina sp.]|nr:SUMF1/EgtB/PvdO family nonheme iron enzyme [gamma proteobacterium symbiont of Taylorina sp.]
MDLMLKSNLSFKLISLGKFSLLLLFFFSMAITNAYAVEKRVALVIGNGNYSDLALKNPVNDASDIAMSLEKLGFNVEVAVDQSRSQIRQKLQEFGQQLEKSDVGFFYYAGHGVQADGVNYLIPVSANMSDQDDVINQAISISSILQKMEFAGNGINIVVLDACRNNPLSKRFRKSSSSQGLAVIKAPSASFIAYATAPGNVAADGSGKNGLYTQYLLENINIPGLTIEQMFKKVRVSVVQNSEGRQVPWENSSLLGEFLFVEALESDKVIVSGHYYSSDQFELDFWKTVQNDPTHSLYEAYLKKYPEGNFSLIAREKLKQMGNGMLTISSNVFGDSIKINGEKRGTSQSTFSLEPNEYSIEISKSGFDTITKKIKVEPEQHLNIQFTLQASSKIANNTRSTAPDLKLLNQIKLPEPELIQTPANDKIPTIEVVAQNLGGVVNEKVEVIINMPFVQVKSDCFSMGSPFLEEGRLNDEKEHQVCLSKDFWIGKFEVTQAQWQKVMGYNPAFFKGCGSNCPVERVSWDEIQGFIIKLNLQTGQKYRLPTEAEWEYAARAGSSLSTYMGDSELLGQNKATNLNKIAWYSGNSGVKYKGGRYCEDWDEKEFPAVRCGTHPVGMKQANPWGLYDMIGNVWEWTHDKYGSLSTRDVTDPKGASVGNKRAVKGGNWGDTLSQNRSAARYGFTQNKKIDRVGFRLVRTIE